MTEREELRRRLYRPGATEADVSAYRRAEPVAPPPPPPRRRRRRGPVAVVAAVALLGGGLLLVPRPAPVAPPAPEATTVPAPSATRAAFLSGLRVGGPAGISPWLDRTRPLPGALAVATRSETIELAGAGPRSVTLRPLTLGDDGGHCTVLLVTIADADAAWSTSRLVIHDDRTIHVAGARTVRVRTTAGEPAVAGFAYGPGDRPTRLRVTVPAGVRWGVAVVFSS